MSRLIADHETTTVWNDGEVYRTDRFHRTRSMPSVTAIPPSACAVCWSRFGRAIPRNQAAPCPMCKDPAKFVPPQEEEIEL